MEIEHLLHCFMSLALSGVILLVIFVTLMIKDISHTKFPQHALKIWLY